MSHYGVCKGRQAGQERQADTESVDAERPTVGSELSGDHCDEDCGRGDLENAFERWISPFID
ncbi:MAG: hypothetical protein EP323_00335 [Gammaproteobacteria bacterium]|nr:MAG: hypothetical protein EP323_00335 [Gammaproteobacteria bacterium]